MRKKIILLFITIALVTGVISTKFPEESLFFGMLIYFFTSYVINKKNKEIKNMTLFMISTFIAIHFIIIIIGTMIKGIEKTHFLGFLYIFYFALSIYVGHLIAKTNILWIKIISVFSFFIITYFASEHLNTIVQQEGNFKTIDGNANYKPNTSSFEVIDSKSSMKLNLSNMNEKTIVVDFWNNNCGVCFQKFSKFQELHQKYINNKNVGFYAINTYRKKEEIIEGQRLFDSLKYNYKTYFQEKQKSDSLKIAAFPTVLVIKNNRIVFKGTIETLSLFDYKYLN